MQLPPRRSIGDKQQLASVRGPDRIHLVTGVPGRDTILASVRAHDVYVAVPRPPRVVGYPLPVRRPRRQEIISRISSELFGLASAGTDAENVLAAIAIRVVDEPLTVARDAHAFDDLVLIRDGVRLTNRCVPARRD